MSNYNIEPLEDDSFGIKRIYKLTSPLVAYLIPKSKISIFRGFESSHRSGVYILFNAIQNLIYIGETGADSVNRLYNQRRNRDFWDTALVFTTDSTRLTPTHAKYIESLLIDRASSLGLNTENSVNSNAPDIPESDIEASKEWEQEIVEITKMLNLKFFVPQNSACSEQRTNSQSSQIPSSYEINNKTYNFSSWVRMMIDLCDRIVLIEGPDLFKNKVLSNQKLKRKRFIEFENQKLDYAPYYQIDNIWLCRHGSADEINKDIKTIISLFPGISFKMLYPNC